VANTNMCGEGMRGTLIWDETAFEVHKAKQLMGL
jgi:hypothetical protein